MPTNFDALGNVLTATDERGNTVTKTYEVGNMQIKKDRNGVTTHYGYDETSYIKS